MSGNQQHRERSSRFDLRSSTYTDKGKEILPAGARTSAGNDDQAPFTSRDELYEALERQLRFRARRRNMGGMPIEMAIRDLKGLFGGGR